MMGGDTTRNTKSGFPEKNKHVMLHIVGNILKGILFLNLSCSDLLLFYHH